MPPEAPSSRASQSTALYDNYYASPRERAWYEVCAAPKAQNILELCLPLKPRRVLDVGAGNGSVLQRYMDGGLGEEIRAVEISESGLVELRKRQSARFVEALPFDGVRIPYPDDSFDLVVLSHVLEHVEHPRLLLHEIRRVARHVYVEVPLEHRSRRSGLAGDWVMDTTGHINYYDRDVIRRLLQTSGWRVDKLIVGKPALEPLKFASGTKGVAQWALIRAVMGVSSRLAESLFCLNCGTLSSRSELPPVSLGLIEAKLLPAAVSAT